MYNKTFALRKACWVIGIVVAAGLRAEPQECSVDVYVNKGVAMPAGMLLYATLKATAMFREIGVKVRTRNGVPAHVPSDTCGAPIVIEIENATGYRGTSGALAYSKPYKDSGASIHVLFDRVRRDRNPAFASTVLAHVMVHEISHVLERVARHSEAGVMKAVWSDQDYQQMKHHPLPFAAEDVELIHDGLARRISLAAAE